MLSQRLSLKPKLTLLFSTEHTDMLDIHMLDTHTDTEPMDTHTPMDTMERDPLMLNQRLMLMLTMDTMDMPDHMPMDTDPMDMDTHTDTDTMARDLLMPSPRPRLTQLSSTPPAMLSTQ